MSKKDIFGDEIPEQKNEASFEQLFAHSDKNLDRRLRVGDEVKGEILTIGKEESYVSTGTPSDGLVLTKDLYDENKQVKYSVGDTIDLVVTAIRNGEIRLSKRGSLAASTDSLEDAFDMELPIEGRVTEIVNGGLRVSIGGKTAFCPISQIDSKFVQDATEFVGKKFEFMITQFDKKGRNIVVSRRKILELQKAESEGAFLQLHKAGDIMNGKVTRLERFGAFVELEGGVEGLVHISELGWSRITDPSEVVTPGQSISVKLLKAEEIDGKMKISLSLKQADGEGNPWNSVPSRFPVGTVVMGKVEKKEVYGMFINIAPGVTGLLPKAKWRDTVDAAQYENKKKGDEFHVQIDQIMFEDKKISLGIPGEGEDNSWKTHTGTTASGLGALAAAFKGINIKSK